MRAKTDHVVYHFTGALMNTENGIFGLRARIFFVLLMGFPHAAYSESIMVGDIEISPQDFSATLDSEQRKAKCLSCHGQHAGGDIDFGPDTRFGTPALRGMREQYLKKSLNDYQTGTRTHKEMSVISAILDEETINFMAHSFAAYLAPPLKSASELTALAEKDALFRHGQSIARQGISQQGVPACISCHGPLGEGERHRAPACGAKRNVYPKPVPGIRQRVPPNGSISTHATRGGWPD